MSVYELSRAKWQLFKKDNNLSKSSVFSKADVGPHIDKFQSAVENFEKVGGKKNLTTAFKKAGDLQKAFTKFINLKEAKGELSAPAKAKITKWKSQLDTIETKLAVFHETYKDELAEVDKDNMVNDFNTWFNWK